MNIICIGYFDKHSRFFTSVRKQLKVKGNNTLKLKIFNIHFSGCLYTLIRFKYSNWVPISAWLRAFIYNKKYSAIINTKKKYHGIDYRKHIEFHLGLNKNISTKALQKQALAYIDIFEKRFKKDKPDYLITIGDSRLCIEIAIDLAKKKGIKVYYIEQGPLNSTFFDDAGVNANLSIRNSEENFIRPNLNDIKVADHTEKYRRSPIYRAFDILFMYLFEKTIFYPPDLKFTDLNSYKKKRRLEKKNHSNSNEKIFLLIFQIPLDVNMVLHSPNFKSHFEILKHVYENLPKNTKLIVREHPLFINKYEKKVYNFIEENDILVDRNFSINNAIKNADVIIVNNSTVGFESIVNYKTTVVLGDAFYDNNKICIKLNSNKELNSCLESALKYSPNKNEIDNFKKLLSSTVLLKGTITDKKLTSSKTIANYLISKK